MGKRATWFFLLALAACGSSKSTGTSGGDITSAVSTTGKLKMALASASPLIQGTNTIEITLTDAATGAVQAGAAFIVRLNMPTMGHPSPITPSVTEKGAGVYEVTNAYFSMPGPWEVIATFTQPQTDSATATVTIP